MPEVQLPYALPESLRQAYSSAVDSAPRRFRRCVDLAYGAGQSGMPREIAVDLIDQAIEGDPKFWGNGKPGAIRASIAIDAACDAAYAAGTREVARATLARAVPTIVADRGGRPLDKSDFELLADVATSETPLSPESILAVVGEHISLRKAAWLCAGRARAEGAWNIVPEHVFDEQESQEMRAWENAGNMLVALPERATVADLAAEILTAYPLIGHIDAMTLATDEVRSSAKPPQRQLSAHPTELWTDVWSAPPKLRMEQHRRAVAMLAVISEGVPLVADEGVEEEAAMLTAERAPEEAWQPLNLNDPAAWLNPPEQVAGTLRSIAFDPDDETPPPAWLAKGLLPRAGISLLFGESGSGKSFAAIHASLAVAWGIPLFGAKTKQGAVLYIAAEGGSSVRRRMKAANKELGGAIAAARLSRPAGTAPHTRAPITIVTEAPDLSREGDVKPLLRTIDASKVEFARTGHRLALVVIDTWHAAMGGADENSAADAGHALKPLIASSEDGDFLTLIVHHPGKDVEKGARGSNALPAAADAILAVKVPGFTGARAKPASAARKVTVTKMRDGDAGREIGYRLRIVPTGVDEDGDPTTTCVVEPVDPPKFDAEGLTKSGREFMDAVEQAIAEEGGERARLETVRLMYYAARRDAKPDAKRKAWQRALDAGLLEGRVAVDVQRQMLWVPDDDESDIGEE